MNRTLILVAASFLTAGQHAMAGEGPCGSMPLIVRYAVLLGSQETDAAQLRDPASPIGELLHKWDPATDNSELKKALSVRGIEEAWRQASTLPADGGAMASAMACDGHEYALELEVEHDQARGLVLQTLLAIDGERVEMMDALLSIGTRAIVVGRRGDRLLFLVCEVSCEE